MPLEPAFFNAISLDLIKNKYFDSKTVIALLEDIRMQALELNAENESLRAQLDELNGRSAVIGDTLVSAKTLAQQILREAGEQADAILEDARAQREELLKIEAGREDAVRRETGAYVRRIRDRLLDCAEDISAEWSAYEGAEAPAPQDLEQKVGAIAAQLFDGDAAKT